jgi:protein-disulfide isomerase
MRDYYLGEHGNGAPLMRLIQLSLVTLLVVVGLSQSPTAQSTSVNPSQRDDAIVNELRLIRLLLERLATQQEQLLGQSPTATTTRVGLGDGMGLGAADAPLSMVEFIDLQCPFCKQYSAETFVQIKRQWIDTGKLKYIVRDFPLDIHSHAMNAARASRCSSEQNRFWEMRAKLMSAETLSLEKINAIVLDLNLDVAAFGNCFASRKYDKQIQQDILDGRRAGISGTPSFVIGRVRDNAVEGPLIAGSMPYSVFEQALTAALPERASDHER